jgi:cytochrome c-type biogenesis protein CcmH/NrfG
MADALFWFVIALLVGVIVLWCLTELKSQRWK